MLGFLLLLAALHNSQQGLVGKILAVCLFAIWLLIPEFVLELLLITIALAWGWFDDRTE